MITKRAKLMEEAIFARSNECLNKPTPAASLKSSSVASGPRSSLRTPLHQRSHLFSHVTILYLRLYIHAPANLDLSPF